jgi:hypothetical protein
MYEIEIHVWNTTAQGSALQWCHTMKQSTIGYRRKIIFTIALN